MRRGGVALIVLVVAWVNRDRLGRWLTDHTKGTRVVTIDPEPRPGDGVDARADT